MNGSLFLFLNLGTPEVMLIVFVALLLFGGKKLPELARGLGQGIREFKDASDGVKREIQRNINSVHEDMDVTSSIQTQKAVLPETLPAPVTAETTVSESTPATEPFTNLEQHKS